MAILSRFDIPGSLDELPGDHRLAWSEKVAGMFDQFTRDDFPQFYNPTVENTPAGLRPVEIAWPAFPAQVFREKGPGPERWRHADSSRDVQDEYCEWSVERDDDKITRITFTTEVPEYWEHVAQNDPDLLLELYNQFVDPGVELDDLFRDGEYVRKNKWNRSTEGRLAHLVQSSNNLFAAVALVAQATILRERENGKPVTDRVELVVCGRLGEPFRNSDPQIADIVNKAATLGDEITFLDPVGLYLDELQSAGMETPDGADAAEFWQVERGSPDHAVRASFAVPEDRDYVVGDIKVNGLPITFGAQVADKVRIRIGTLVKPGEHKPVRRRCEQ